jgi:hypothetical protein
MSCRVWGMRNYELRMKTTVSKMCSIGKGVCSIQRSSLASTITQTTSAMDQHVPYPMCKRKEILSRCLITNNGTKVRDNTDIIP